jgi:uncharacterized protein
MDEKYLKNCTVFHNNRRLAAGELAQVVGKVKKMIDRPEGEAILIFDDANGALIDVDFHGTINDVLKRLEKGAEKRELDEASASADQNIARGPGRPKLGVVSREVTLLPRHWEWLNGQPGGASVALRRLVDEGRRANSGRDKVRHAQEAAYRFMSAIAGNLPGYEEATRALFAGNRQRLDDSIASWPADIREYALKLSQAVFPDR